MGDAYIHYGSSEFIPEKFKPIENGEHRWTKPRGGLWSSPISSDCGWKQWCEAEQYRVDLLGKSFTFELDDDVKVLEITSGEDASKLEKYANFHGNERSFPGIYSIDFEAIVSDGYSAILALAGTDYSVYHILYGWDCDTLLVLDKGCVRPCEHKRQGD